MHHGWQCCARSTLPAACTMADNVVPGPPYLPHAPWLTMLCPVNLTCGMHHGWQCCARSTLPAACTTADNVVPGPPYLPHAPRLTMLCPVNLTCGMHHGWQSCAQSTLPAACTMADNVVPSQPYLPHAPWLTMLCLVLPASGQLFAAPCFPRDSPLSVPLGLPSSWILQAARLAGTFQGVSVKHEQWA